MKTLLNKTVRLYPCDTYSKTAIIKEINELGFIFEIIKADALSRYEAGQVIFISHSKKLSFEIMN